ncbi:MAG TPA: redoxin family protein, partial [Phycisphaerae bacterium]|nr:redoxin family protein [Phycisphaerae bacterium]
MATNHSPAATERFLQQRGPLRFMRFIRWSLIAAAVICGWPTVVHIASAAPLDFNALEQAALKGDSQSLAQLQAAADSGNVLAQNYLGVYYFSNNNFAQAFNWIQKSAEQGNALAQANLGFLYVRGEGTQENDQQAFNWFLKSANQGDIDACNSLAIMFSHGVGTAPDQQKAQFWANRAKQFQTRAQTQNTQNTLVNKPIVIQSVTLNGEPFSTDSLKGRVLVVDYWATWCEWCVKSLPDLTALYQKYHQNGLEVVSISNDSDINALRKFLAQHPEMVWPQIFDAAHPGMNPTDAQFSVWGFPTQFVIDRQGVLRNVIVGY